LHHCFNSALFYVNTIAAEIITSQSDGVIKPVKPLAELKVKCLIKKSDVCSQMC